MMTYRIEVRLDGKDNISPEIRNIRGELRGLENESGAVGGLAGRFGDLGKSIAGAVSAFIVFKGANILNDTIEAGRAVNTATVAFNAWAREIGGASAVMTQLRSATGGVVNDMTLMTSASDLLSLGIAKSSEQLTEMVGMVSRLSALRPGQSLAEGMDAFLRVMKNGSASIEMLDNIGISAARVKEILAETGASISDSAAFSDAVVRAGQETLTRVGDAANIAENALNRFQTKIDNVILHIQDNVGLAITSLAGLLEIAIGEHPQQRAEKALEEEAAASARQMALAQAFALRDLLGKSFLTDTDAFTIPVEIDTELFLNNIRETLDVFASNDGLDFVSGRILTLSEQFDVAIDQAMRAQDLAVYEFPEFTDLLRLAFDQYTASADGVISTLDQVTRHAMEAQAALDKMKSGGYDSPRRVETMSTTELDNLREVVTLRRQVNAANERSLELRRAEEMRIGLAFDRAQARAEIEYYDELIERQARVQAFQNLARTGAQSDLARFFAEAGAAARDLSNVDLEPLAVQYERIQQMGAAGLISQSDVERAQAIYDRLNAVSKMNLRELLGVGGGGVRGEISDLVLDMVPEDMRDDVRRVFDLMSGRANDLSVTMEDHVIPMLAELTKADPALAAQAIARITDFLTTMAGAGITPDPEAVIRLALGVPTGPLPNFGGPGGKLVVRPGDTPGALAAQYGLSVEDILRITGSKNTRTLKIGTFDLPGGAAGGSPFDFDFSELAGQVEPVRDAFQVAADNAQNIRDNMAELTATLHRVVIDFEAKMPPLLEYALKLLQGGQLVPGGARPTGGGRATHNPN